MEILTSKGGFSPLNFAFSYREEEREFECERHGKVAGRAILNGENVVAVVCLECEKERAEAEKRAQESAEKSALEARWARQNIGREFWEKSISDYAPKTEGQKKALSAVQDLIAGRVQKLILLGPNGSGKTMLAAMALKAMGGVSYTMFGLSLKIRSLKDMSEEEFAESLVNAPLLVIDEVGRSKGSEFEMNLLSYVLDKRHSRGKPFAVLSNLHFSADCPENKGRQKTAWQMCPRCFERYFDEDLLSRFREGGRAVVIEGDAPDYRNPKNKSIWRIENEVL